MTEVCHPIRSVARLTGLSPFVIRIWEQRYRAVEPARSPSNRRLYSQRHIDRLGLLREVTQAGHSIGQVAQLPIETLRRLATESAVPRARPARAPSEAPPSQTFLDEGLAAVRALDGRALAETLERGGTALGALGLLQRVVAPLAQTIGERWREGALTAAHEHFATAELRVFLGNAARAFGSLEAAPVLVVATPAGQVHELGALLVGATAANLGWQVVYLGASLPAAEIAGAARQRRARAVALSLVYPEDDPQLDRELTRLRGSLPDQVVLLVGGRAAPAYATTLAKIGAILVDDLAHLGNTLDELRKPVKKTKP